MNVERRKVAADSQIKPTDLGCESAGCYRLHPPSPSTYIYTRRLKRHCAPQARVHNGRHDTDVLFAATIIGADVADAAITQTRKQLAMKSHNSWREQKRTIRRKPGR